HAPVEPELGGPAAVPARGHDALALALGVVVPAREFAPVVVAGLSDRERRRGAKHDKVPASMVRPAPCRTRSKRSPVEGGSVPRGSEASKAERPPVGRSQDPGSHGAGSWVVQGGFEGGGRGSLDRRATAGGGSGPGLRPGPGPKAGRDLSD